jgi:hypothetical protein
MIPKRLPFTSSNTRSDISGTHSPSTSAGQSSNPISGTVPPRTNSKPSRDPELGSGYVGQSTPRLVKKELNERWPYKEVVTAGETKKETTVEEVWFSGCHSDVGGGTVPDSDAHALSSISLRWMLKECTKLQVGLLFDKAALRRAGLLLRRFTLLRLTSIVNQAA